MTPPDIKASTKEERLAYVRAEYKCISNCENCGLCQFFHGKDAEEAYADYINGVRDYMTVTKEIRDNR